MTMTMHPLTMTITILHHQIPHHRLHLFVRQMRHSIMSQNHRQQYPQKQTTEKLLRHHSYKSIGLIRMECWHILF